MLQLAPEVNRAFSAVALVFHDPGAVPQANNETAPLALNPISIGGHNRLYNERRARRGKRR